MSRKWFAFPFLVLISGALAGPARIEELVGRLASEEAREQARARQMLFHEGPETVPYVLPLLSHEKESVWRAAFNVLEDIANDVSAPGRTRERAAVAQELMSLVAPDKSNALKERGLRLLPLVIPQGQDLAPIAALLGDAEMREKARAALLQTGTKEARDALRAALGTSDPPFQVALLNALGELEDNDSLETIRRFAVTGPAEVQVAAVRALAWTGDPSLIKLAKGVRDAAAEGLKSEAEDALLRLLRVVARKGGNWEIAVKTYEELIATGGAAAKGGSLVALGELGDERHVTVILNTIGGDDPELFRIGIDALGRMQGANAARRLASLYPGLSREVQLAVLPILGKHEDEAAAAVLKEAAQSEDRVFRSAGLAGLGRSGRSDAIPFLLAAAEKGESNEKDQALGGLLAVGAALGERGKTHEAGQAYLGVWNFGGSNEWKLRALEGVARHPSPDALDAAMEASRDSALRETALKALIGVAGALVATAQPEKAVEAYRRVAALSPDMASLQKLAEDLRASKVDMNLAEMVGFLTRWSLVGPFPLGENKEGWSKEFVQEPAVDLKACYTQGDQNLCWKEVRGSGDLGKVDLLAEVASCEACLAYALAEFSVEEEQDAVLSLGVDDGEKVWVNQSLVLDNFRIGGLVVDQDKVPVHLVKGANTLLLKVYQNNMPWEFCARLLTPEGNPVKFRQ
ncbi:MAG: hypothetical protein GHCLOJNM_00139 [bacterium]|nr:hypothetical protein [bacterium]